MYNTSEHPELRGMLEELLPRVAASDYPVLLQGESGTGKEHLARLIHQGSRRAKGPFIKLTGPLDEHVLHSAAGGTLYLDELGESTPQEQAVLLRVLSDEGSGQPAVRAIAATGHDLPELVRQGRLRSDLYYRLNVLNLRLPPLRERMEDMRFLVPSLLATLATELGLDAAPTLSHDAKAALLSYRWPGNLRELKNSLRSALVHAGGDTIAVRHLPQELLPVPPAGRTVYERFADAVNRALLLWVLQECKGDRTRAARELGLSRAGFYKRLHKHGIIGSADGTDPDRDQADG